jgi:hypothetical protein
MEKKKKEHCKLNKKEHCKLNPVPTPGKLLKVYINKNEQCNCKINKTQLKNQFGCELGPYAVAIVPVTTFYARGLVSLNEDLNLMKRTEFKNNIRINFIP